MKSFIQSIDSDLRDNITDGPSVPNWIIDDGNIIIKPKSDALTMTMKGLRKILESYIFYNVL